MERGTRLEPEAIERFAKETGKKVNTDLIIWERDDNASIAISPDGIIGRTAALEAKCLSSARHIEAFLTKKVPDEYEMQVIQYFIVNDTLKTLYMVFYDPRVTVKDFFYLTVNRTDVQENVDAYHAYLNMDEHKDCNQRIKALEEQIESLKEETTKRTASYGKLKAVR